MSVCFGSSKHRYTPRCFVRFQGDPVMLLQAPTAGKALHFAHTSQLAVVMSLQTLSQWSFTESSPYLAQVFGTWGLSHWLDSCLGSWHESCSCGKSLWQVTLAEAAITAARCHCIQPRHARWCHQKTVSSPIWRNLAKTTLILPLHIGCAFGSWGALADFNCQHCWWADSLCNLSNQHCNWVFMFNPWHIPMFRF